jgi:hypothetical protein
MLLCARKTKPTVPLELTFVWAKHEHDMLIKHWIESWDLLGPKFEMEAPLGFRRD